MKVRRRAQVTSIAFYAAKVRAGLVSAVGCAAQRSAADELQGVHHWRHVGVAANISTAQPRQRANRPSRPESQRSTVQAGLFTKFTAPEAVTVVREFAPMPTERRRSKAHAAASDKDSTLVAPRHPRLVLLLVDSSNGTWRAIERHARRQAARPAPAAATEHKRAADLEIRGIADASLEPMIRC
jgi:hypothetical protein